MIAAKVAQRSHCNNALDEQRATSATISIVTAGDIVKFYEFRKILVWSCVVYDAEGGGEINHGVA